MSAREGIRTDPDVAFGSIDKADSGAPRPPAPPPLAPPPPPVDPQQQRGALLRLVLFVTAAALISIAAGVGKTVAVVAAIVLMIVLHEFGHFVMAKLSHIKVTEFFVGFGTRLWSVRWGETEYGVKALPLGGYVKIVGMNNLEEVDPADEPRSYRQKPFWRKLSVVSAGSAVHFLLALVMLFTVFFFVGDRGNFVNASADQYPIGAIYGLSTGPSPAQEAGFHLGDRILSVNGHTFSSWEDQVAYIQQRPGQTLDVEVSRHGQVLHLHPRTVDLSKVTVTPSQGAPAAQSSPAATPAAPTGFIGIGAAPPNLRFGFFDSISRAGGQFVNLSARTFDALGNLVSAHGISSYGHMLVNQKAADSPTATTRFSSPVAIVRLANSAASNGIEDVLFLLILINIFVGIFNMLPLLPLDGGHVAIAIYEKVRSRKGRQYHADVLKLLPLTYAFVLIMVFIFITSVFLDARDLLSVIHF